MNPCDEIKKMVRRIPGGWDVLAVICGGTKTGDTLRQCFSPDSRYVPNLLDACAISDYAISIQSPDCYAFVNAIAATAGGFVRLDPNAPRAETLLDATVGLMQDSTAVLGAVTAARADSVISDNERKEIERHASKVIADMQAVLAEVARENEAAHLRVAK